MGALRDLQAKSDHEVEALYDAAMANTVVGVSFYRDELVRREAVRGTRELIRLTQEIRWLTVAVGVAAFVALAISVVALISG